MSDTSEKKDPIQPPSLEEFISAHRPQLENLKVPKVLWKVLHKKLFAPKFIEDEDLFEIVSTEHGGFQLKAKKNIRRWADIYVIPHVAAGNGEDLYKLLRVSPEITQYLWDMVNMDKLIERSDQAKEDLVKRLRVRKQELEKIRDEKKRVADLDKESIEILMDQADVTYERAVQALAETQGDLVQAISECMLTPEFKRIEEQINNSLYGQHKHLDDDGEKYFASAIERKKKKDAEKAQKAEQDNDGTPSDDAAPSDIITKEVDDIEQIDQYIAQYEQEKEKKPQTEEAKYLQRVIMLYNALFDNHYVNYFLSMTPRGRDSKFTGPIQPEEIVKTYYIMDKFGSAVVFNQEPNVKLEHFICLSSGNTSWSIMYASRDIKAGEIIYRPIIAPVPCPLKFEW